MMRHRLRRWSTIALLAIFGLAFAPTISRALAHAHGEASFQEVCTTQAMKLASTQADAPVDGRPAGLSHLSHCPLCGLGAQALVMLVALPPFAPPEGLGQAPSASLLPAPLPLVAWAQAQPRAPPFLG